MELPEETFFGSKSLLGFEQPQGWSRSAVLRTAPVAMLLYSLVVLWFARDGHILYRPLDRPWDRTKSKPSFADMLTTLKRASLHETLLTRVQDVVVGATKALAYGLAVPLWACLAGLDARGGAPGVGRATTVAVINSSIAVLALDLVISSAAFLLEGA